MAHRMDPPRRATARAATREEHEVEANARLTGMTAALLLVMLAAEGVTVLSVRSLLTPHVVIGAALIGPVLLKVASTTYRFARYYTNAPAFRKKGPPPVLLRLLGPFVVLLSLALLATGVVALYLHGSLRSDMLLLHKASFVLWFGAMAIHVLGHLIETARLAPRDFYWRTRRQVRGASLRQWALLASLALGALIATLVVGQVGRYLAG